MKVKIYTDGSYLEKYKVGGWAAIITSEHDEEITVSGGTFHSPKNMESINAQRMEVMAVLQGLLALTYPSEVKIVTDSSYVNDTISKGWLDNWVKKGDLSKKHLDLWMMIYNLSKIHNISSERVKAHSGHFYNERCDTLARNEAFSQMELPEYKSQLSNTNSGPSLFDLTDNQDLNSLDEDTLPFSDELPFSEITSKNSQQKEENPFEGESHLEETLVLEKEDIVNNSIAKKPAKRKKSKKKTKKGFYAVAKGRNIGIYNTWGECQKQVNKFKGAIFKKFDTEEEAQHFINLNKNK